MIDAKALTALNEMLNRPPLARWNWVAGQNWDWMSRKWPGAPSEPDGPVIEGECVDLDHPRLA